MQIEVITLSTVNVFLVKAKDGFVLIDTAHARQWKRLESGLTAAGCLPDRLRLVLVTHGDWDHIGNCAMLQQRYRVRIAMHPRDLAAAQGSVVPDRLVRPLHFRIAFALLKRFGVKLSVQPFTPDLLLTDGQRLDDVGLPAKVLSTPGHTKGSIAILTDDGELFAGDTVTNRKRPDYSEFIDDLPALKNSIAKLKAFASTTIFPGHGKPFSREDLLKIVL